MKCDDCKNKETCEECGKPILSPTPFKFPPGEFKGEEDSPGQKLHHSH